MFLNKLVGSLLSVFLTLAGLVSATELRLVRFGPIGKAGLIDDQNQIHDLSAFIEDITLTSSDEALEEIAEIPLDQIPVVPD